MFTVDENISRGIGYSFLAKLFCNKNGLCLCYATLGIGLPLVHPFETYAFTNLRNHFLLESSVSDTSNP